MPLYEYGCDACGHTLEIQQKLSEEPLRTCPSCGKDELHKIISATSFVLKGGGWYKDGYGSTQGKLQRTDNQRGDRVQKAIADDKAKTEAAASGGTSTPSSSSDAKSS